MPTGYLGIAELIIALLLSYTVVMYTDAEADVLVKGTIIFFISLIILMIFLVIIVSYNFFQINIWRNR